jgi:hypothetical protein
VTDRPFALLPEEAFLDAGITLAGLRVLRLIWKLCLREGRIVWTSYMTSKEMGEQAGLTTNAHLAEIIRGLIELEYIQVGPNTGQGVYAVRPHPRYGESGPTAGDILKLYGPSRVREAKGQNEPGQPLTLPHRCFTTTENIPKRRENKSSSSRSRTSRQKVYGTSPAGEGLFPVRNNPVQEAILELLAENGMEGAVPTAAAMQEGMTFRRVLLLVNDGLAKDHSTGMMLTRIRGKDIPSDRCPLCRGKLGFHTGFSDRIAGINCPLYDNPDMDDEALAVAWRLTKGMRRLEYWNPL